MATFGEVGERDLIETVRKTVRRSGSPDDLTDDAAVIAMPEGKIVLCSDILSFERHMPKTMTYEQFGWMCAAANLSDLASMGATPKGLLVSLNLPLSMEVKDICDIMSGIDQCAEFAETYIIGGDTKPGNGAVSVAAVGSMEDREPMTRKGAKEGDVIAVTGPLGGPAAGYHAIENGIELPDSVARLMVPIPRVSEGLALCRNGFATSCIDLSDGLSTCIRTLCRESSVGAVIEWDLLPRDEGVSVISEKLNIPEKEMLMDWGGEYELLFTFDRKDLNALLESDIDFQMIGLVTDSECLLHRNGKYEEIEDGCY